MLSSLPIVLRAIIGDEVVAARYDWGANRHLDLCWKPMKVGTSRLDRSIRESSEHRIIVPGQSDFLFGIRGEALEVEFRHDAHLHVSGTDENLIGRVLSDPRIAIAGATLVSGRGVRDA